MTNARRLALFLFLLVGAFAIVALSNALGSDRWVPGIGAIIVMLLASLIDPVYFGWRDEPRNRER